MGQQIANLRQIANKIDLTKPFAEASGMATTRFNKTLPTIEDTSISSLEGILDDKAYEN